MLLTEAKRDPRHLVVVDPPHPGPLDLGAIARELQTLPADAQALVTAGLPTACQLAADRAMAEAAIARLACAGLRCASVTLDGLRGVPVPEQAHQISVDGEGISWSTTQGTEGTLRWRQLRTALVLDLAGEPRRSRAEAVRPASGGWKGDLARGISGALATAATGVRVGTSARYALEVGGATTRGPRRARLPMERLISTRLDAAVPTVHGKWLALLQLVAERAPDVAIDRRAAGARAGLAPRAASRAQLGGLPEAERAVLSSPLEFFAAYACALAGIGI
ncbi:MAG: hypothetical protein HY744_12755 [Deltaproteobacteria bacterium]|nr:hypothetical protein [Deltaproteobacteria bacterium]